jgi:hypothetical protein
MPEEKRFSHFHLHILRPKNMIRLIIFFSETQYIYQNNQDHTKLLSKHHLKNSVN